MVTVVLVEDHEGTRSGLAQLLAGHGYRVLAVRDFDEAQAALAAPGADLLITDVRLEGRNGLQLLATAPEGLAAIVLTGFDDPALAREATALGATFLVKPCAPGTLLEAVQMQLARPTRVRSNAAGRVWRRRPVLEQVTVQIGEMRGEIRDISLRGAGFHSLGEPPLNAVTTVSFTHEGSTIALPFQLHWRRKVDHGRWISGGSVATPYEELWRGVTDGWR